MNSSKKLSKYKIRNTLPSCTPRTDDRNRLLDESPVSRRFTDADERYDRYLDRSEYPKTKNKSIDDGAVARRNTKADEGNDRYLERPDYQQTKNESIMRYHGNNGKWS